MEPAPPRNWPAALAAVSGCTLVGVMPLAARTLYADGFSPASMLFWRYSLAVIALALVARALAAGLRQAWRAGGWRIVLVGATLGSAQTLCFWESLKTLDTSIAVLLFYTYPAATLLLDRLLFRHPIRPVAVLCIVVILAGAGLITVPAMRGGAIAMSGLSWAMPAPIFYAVYLAVNSRLLRHHSPVVGAVGLFSGMAVTFGIIAGFEGLAVPAQAGTWLLLLFIALGPGALTITLFSYAVPRLGASSFAILANAELVTVVLIGTTVLGEAVTPSLVIGGTMIVAGIVTHALWRGATPPARLRAEIPSAPVGKRMSETGSV